jgi:hypothetical protein
MNIIIFLGTREAFHAILTGIIVGIAVLLTI